MIAMQYHIFLKASRWPIWVTALSMSLVIIFFIFWIDIGLLPDYSNYLSWAEEFQERPWAGLGFFEFLGFAQIKFFGSIENSVDAGLQKLYVFNAIIAILGLFGLSVRYAKTATGVFLVYILYGPLLSYITLRATPAYILISWLILISKDIKNKFLLMAIPLLYHFSSLIPSILVAVVEFLNLNGRLNFKKNKLNFNILIIFLFFIGIFFQIIWISGIGDGAAQFIAGFFNLGDKIQEYLDTAAVYRSPAHFGYYIFVLISTCFYLYLTCDSVEGLWWVIFLALLAFMFMSISPVVAYRFSIFFLLPVFLDLPQAKTALTYIFKNLVFFTGVAIGAFQLFSLF